MKVMFQSHRVWLMLVCVATFVVYFAVWTITFTRKVETPPSGPNRKYSWHVPVSKYRLDFILNPKGECADLFLVVMVTSRHDHFEARAAIRQTWGNATSIMGRKVATLFLIGRTDDPLLQRKLVAESRRHGDIIQMDPYESYENLTLKTISALKWTLINCKQSQFLMKVDDDMFVNYPKLARTLAEYHRSSRQENLMLGCVVSWAFPERNPGKKWYMDVEIFPRWLYPPYCIGAGYVMSLDVARHLYMISLKVPIVQIEDVYLGICAEKAGIKPQNHPEFSCWKDTAYRYCEFRELITAHGMKPRDLIQVWKDLKIQGNRNCSLQERFLEKVSSLI